MVTTQLFRILAIGRGIRIYGNPETLHRTVYLLARNTPGSPLKANP